MAIGLVFCWIDTSRNVCDENIPANGAYVGLAPPGDVGSWQSEVKVILILPEPYVRTMITWHSKPMHLNGGKI